MREGRLRDVLHSADDIRPEVQGEERRDALHRCRRHGRRGCEHGLFKLLRFLPHGWAAAGKRAQLRRAVRRQWGAVLRGWYVQRAEHVRERHVSLVRTGRGRLLPAGRPPALLHAFRCLLQWRLSARRLPHDHNDQLNDHDDDGRVYMLLPGDDSGQRLPADMRLLLRER